MTSGLASRVVNTAMRVAFSNEQRQRQRQRQRLELLVLLRHPSDRSLRRPRSQSPARLQGDRRHRSFTRPGRRRDESSPAVGVARTATLALHPPKVSYRIVPPRACASKGWMGAPTLGPGGPLGGTNALGTIRSMLERFQAFVLAVLRVLRGPISAVPAPAPERVPAPLAPV
jgi:hypothetical protein